MGRRHLTPGTAEWHAFNVGLLVTNLELPAQRPGCDSRGHIAHRADAGA